MEGSARGGSGTVRSFTLSPTTRLPLGCAQSTRTVVPSDTRRKAASGEAMGCPPRGSAPPPAQPRHRVLEHVHQLLLGEVHRDDGVLEEEDLVQQAVLQRTPGDGGAG